MICISFITPMIQAVTTRQTAMISYVEQCKVGPGFGNTTRAKEPTLEATFQALYILKAYNSLNMVNVNSLISWVNTCRKANHGFGNTNRSAADIVSTYYATWIFKLFNRQLDNRTDDWVAACQNKSTAFGETINATATLIASYYGLEALYLNNTNLKAYNISTWLLGRQNKNPSSDGFGGFATDGNSSNMWAAWAAIGSIKQLNLNGYLVEPLISWINRSQNIINYDDDYGAFSNKPGDMDWSLLDTYTAIYCLKKLGNTYLGRIHLQATLDWLIDLQNSDGGFRVNSIIADSSLSATFYAFSILDLLDQENLLSTGVPWESPFALPLWAWVLIGIAIVIAAVFIIKKFYMD